jgi:hypothetical protein
MTSFIKKKKKAVNSINDLDSKDTNIIIPQINIPLLDKEYLIKEIKDKASDSLNNKTFIKFIDDDFSVDDKLKASSFIGGRKKKEIVSKEDKIKSDIKNITTNLQQLGISNEQKNNNIESFISSEKIKVKLYSSLKDLSKNLIPEKTHIHCWWCKHSIPDCYHPIGCPIKFNSETKITQEYFDTDGIFCSFNCCLAYANDLSIYNIRYRESGALILLLYKKIFNQSPFKGSLKAAPDWRLLKMFGGILSIDEFRNSFQTLNNLNINFIKSDKNNFMLPTFIQYVEESNHTKTKNLF